MIGEIKAFSGIVVWSYIIWKIVRVKEIYYEGSMNWE